jgi:hypothetical protein
MAQIKLVKAQHGLESTPGTLVAATFIHKGSASLKIDDAIAVPEFDYNIGTLGGNVEGAFIADTGSTLTWEDCDLSAADMTWLGNTAIKTVLTGATADNGHSFTFPSSSANTISYFTHELSTATQEYEFGYGFCESFSVHGDVAADNGRIMYSAVHKGRATAASTVTASLGFLANVHPLNINYATVHFDTIGTAAGTAAATATYLRAFSMEIKTGWTAEAARYADGRSTKDFSVPTFTNYEWTGNIRVKFGSQAVTHIASARAGTPAAMAIKCAGASSTTVNFNMPFVFTDVPSIGSGDEDGLHTVEFPFRVGYSRTTTAQAPSISTKMAAETTVT